MKKTIYCLFIVALAGCASSTGVVPMGKDTFMVSRTDNTPVASMGSMKAAALNEASDYCGKSGNTFEVVGGQDVPRSFGQFPQVEVQFRCIPK